MFEKSFNCEVYNSQKFDLLGWLSRSFLQTLLDQKIASRVSDQDFMKGHAVGYARASF